MTGEISKQTLAVLVAVVLVLSVVGTWMVMTSNTGDVNVPETQTKDSGQVHMSFDNGESFISEDYTDEVNTATGLVAYGFR